MSIFGDIKGFDAAEPDDKEIHASRVYYNFCIYCSRALNPALKRQYCSLCCIERCSISEYLSYPSNKEISKLSGAAENKDADPIISSRNLSKEERYQLIFNYTTTNPTVKAMSNDELAAHLDMLERTLEDLLFEKRSEIQAIRHTLADRLEDASEHERERVRKLDQEYTRKRQKAEGEKVEARREKISKKEAFIQRMVKLGVERAKAEDMARDIK